MEPLHGGDIYDKDVRLDFSVNINPRGMPEAVLQAALSGVKDSTTYPDVKNTRLRELISACWSVPEDALFFGNGTAELMMTAVQAVPSDVYILPVPSFQEYERAAGSVSGEIHWIPLSEEKEFLLGEEERDRILDAAEKTRREQKTATILLGNPNNPTGQCVPREILAELAEYSEKKNVRLIVDESFLPFVPDSKERSLIQKAWGSEQILVLCSMTKIYAIPGLRAGVMISGNDTLLQQSRERTQPWRLSLPAQRAMEAAVQETDWIRKTIELIEKERIYLRQELSHGLARKVISGEAPFFLLAPEPPDLKEQLLREGILIRDCRNFRELHGDFVRIGIRTHEENTRLIEAWRNIVWQQKA